MKQSNPKPTDHYSPRNVERFLKENFTENRVMRYRLTGLIAGVREQAYQQGRRDAMNGRIVENIILKTVITEDVIMSNEMA
jgi:hypothetical protein